MKRAAVSRYAATIVRAAELLEEHASSLYEACSGRNRGWACGDCETRGGKCLAQREYDELVRVAKALRTGK